MIARFLAVGVEERAGVCNVGVKPTVEAAGGVVAEVHLLEVITFGAFGRLWLGGWEAEIASAKDALEASLAAIQGRENKG